MEVIVISGMSGAGKSTALGVLEDMGYFCMDNVPPDILLNMVELMKHPSVDNKRLAAVVDVRSGEFGNIRNVIEQLKRMNVKVKIVFLDSKDDVLMNRYNLTRRRHPLSDGSENLKTLITRERKILSNIREMSNYIVDTSLLNSHELRKQIVEIVRGSAEKRLSLYVESFGFKYGLSVNSDFVFDARFLPNPYYVRELANKTGLDLDVKKYFEEFDVVKEYVLKIVKILEFVMKSYSQEAKDTLYVSIGCTGGKHRSVYIAEKISEHFSIHVNVKVSHRDINR